MVSFLFIRPPSREDAERSDAGGCQRNYNRVWFWKRRFDGSGGHNLWPYSEGRYFVRRTLWVLVLATALTMALVAPVGATAPSEVNITVESSLLGDPGPFVASGPAVDVGVICAAGVVVDDSGKVSGFSPNGFNFNGIKHFICDDGSGEFFVNLQARIDFRKGITFNWNVLSGIGAYEDLHGAGSGFGLGGVPCGDPELCVLDLYEGGFHID